MCFKLFKIFIPFSLIILACTSTSLNAQVKPDKIKNKTNDGFYIPEKNVTKKVIPYTHVREADVLWSKRVWQRIDLQEKINHPLYYPIEEINNRQSLFDVIKHGITNNYITAYGNAAFDDEFKSPLTKTEALASLSEMTVIYREDENEELIEDSVPEEITSGDIKQYWIKEEWFFDRERSVIDVRILGIAPVREKMDEDGVTVRGVIPLFWIYFPEARYTFVNAAVFNRFNDAERMSFDDLFWKRMFSSYITKESNVYNRQINEYKTGIDAILESEDIKNSLFNFEQDFWNY